MFEYRLGWITTGAIFCLIVLGGFVHNIGASLACPDWPLCHGQVFPQMVGGVRYEHSHRLIAASVGLLTILLAFVVTGRRPTDTTSRLMTRVAVLLVVFQGLLGGITVIFQLPAVISVAHLATSMAFFLLMITITQRLSPHYVVPQSRPSGLVGWVVLLVYLQIILGAVVRHSGSGLSCLEIPLCLGSLWPAGVDWMVKLQMAHRIGALLVAFAVTIVAIKKSFLFPLLLVALEIMLGLLSVSSRLGVWQVTSHLGVAALLLATLWLLFLQSRYKAAR